MGNTTKKLTNTNENTDGFFPSLTPLVNTDRNMSSVYIEGISIKIEGMKKKQSVH
jgi:hypothetical protein